MELIGVRRRARAAVRTTLEPFVLVASAASASITFSTVAAATCQVEPSASEQDNLRPFVTDPRDAILKLRVPLTPGVSS